MMSCILMAHYLLILRVWLNCLNLLCVAIRDTIAWDLAADYIIQTTLSTILKLCHSVCVGSIGLLLAVTKCT